MAGPLSLQQKIYSMSTQPCFFSEPSTWPDIRRHPSRYDVPFLSVATRSSPGWGREASCGLSHSHWRAACSVAGEAAHSASTPLCNRWKHTHPRNRSPSLSPTLPLSLKQTHKQQWWQGHICRAHRNTHITCDVNLDKWSKTTWDEKIISTLALLNNNQAQVGWSKNIILLLFVISHFDMQLKIW